MLLVFVVVVVVIFFSFKEFSNQCPHVKTNFLVYEVIIAAIREYINLGTTYNRLLTMVS